MAKTKLGGIVNFKASREEARIIEAIARRTVLAAHRARLDYDFMTAVMDITAVHSNGCSLRLAELLAADDFNFNHDVFGICRYIDRETGELTDFFVPRFARHD